MQYVVKFTFSIIYGSCLPFGVTKAANIPLFHRLLFCCLFSFVGSGSQNK